MLLNISLLPYHHEKLHTFPNSVLVKPKIIVIWESCIRKDRQPISNISILNYMYVHTLTEASTGGTLIYRRESYFNKNRKSIFVDSIYKHLSSQKFLDDFMLPLPGKRFIWEDTDNVARRFQVEPTALQYW